MDTLWSEVLNPRKSIKEMSLLQSLKHAVLADIDSIISSASKWEIEPTHCIDLLDMIFSWPVETVKIHQNYILKILIHLQENRNNKSLNLQYRKLFNTYVRIFEYWKDYEQEYDLSPFYEKDSEIITIYTINKKSREIYTRTEKKQVIYDKDRKQRRTREPEAQIIYSWRGHRDLHARTRN